MGHDRHAARRDAKQHVLQLFDTSASLANAVSTFLFQGWQAGDHLLVITRSQHWKLIRARLEARGCAVPAAIIKGRLTIIDAHATLARVLRQNAPDAALFQDRIGTLIGRLAGRPIRVYSELAELLAEERDFNEACRLEELWSDLAAQEDLSVLCGYSSAHFADTGASEILRTLCTSHTRVQRNTTDVLGRFVHERSRVANRKEGGRG